MQLGIHGYQNYRLSICLSERDDNSVDSSSDEDYNPSFIMTMRCV